MIEAWSRHQMSKKKNHAPLSFARSPFSTVFVLSLSRCPSLTLSVAVFLFLARSPFSFYCTLPLTRFLSSFCLSSLFLLFSLFYSSPRPSPSLSLRPSISLHLSISPYLSLSRSLSLQSNAPRTHRSGQAPRR